MKLTKELFVKYFNKVSRDFNKLSRIKYDMTVLYNKPYDTWTEMDKEKALSILKLLAKEDESPDTDPVKKYGSIRTVIRGNLV